MLLWVVGDGRDKPHIWSFRWENLLGNNRLNPAMLVQDVTVLTTVVKTGLQSAAVWTLHKAI